MSFRPHWLAIALLFCTSCPSLPGPPEEHAALPSVEPVLPTVEATPETQAPSPAWVNLLPQAPVAARQGDRVWATPPQAGHDIPTVGVYRVTEVQDTRASLVDKLGQQVESVPGGVIHPLIEDHKFRRGDFALCDSLTTPGIIARVASVTRGRVGNVDFDWGGQTKQKTMDYCGPLRETLAPLARVSFPKANTRSLGLVVALTGEHAWIRTDSGHIEVHDRKPLQVVRMIPLTHTAGTRVRAYRWASGIRLGTITQVLESELRFEVKFPGQAPPAPYFVTQLLSP